MGSLGKLPKATAPSPAFSHLLRPCLICTSDTVPFTKLLFVQKPLGGGEKLLPLQPLPLAGTCSPIPTPSLAHCVAQGLTEVPSSFSPALPEMAQPWPSCPPQSVSPQPFLPTSPALSSELLCSPHLAQSCWPVGLCASSLPDSWSLRMEEEP